MARAKTLAQTIDAKQFAVDCARIADENKAEDVVVLDLRDRSTICDYFIICTGTSDRQMRTIADYIDEHAEKLNQTRYNLSGYDQSNWVLADYVDVVIHIFNEDSRKYYDLELLWGDAPRLEWRG
jgi:ribosome-associated protein